MLPQGPFAREKQASDIASLVAYDNPIGCQDHFTISDAGSDTAIADNGYHPVIRGGPFVVSKKKPVPRRELVAIGF